MPTMTLPCGKNAQGVPLSGQLAGHSGKDPVLLAPAHEIMGQIENTL
jgi:Asp-tRNA(Asn)/Glu-tRNA(Gln) amidotransferase A subunit family amidase